MKGKGKDCYAKGGSVKKAPPKPKPETDGEPDMEPSGYKKGGAVKKGKGKK